MTKLGFEGIFTPLRMHAFLVHTRKGKSTLQLVKDEVTTSFTRLQREVFHALLELHHGWGCRLRPPGVPALEAREFASRSALEARRVDTNDMTDVVEGGECSWKRRTTSATHIAECCIRIYFAGRLIARNKNKKREYGHLEDEHFCASGESDHCTIKQKN